MTVQDLLLQAVATTAYLRPDVLATYSGFQWGRAPGHDDESSSGGGGCDRRGMFAEDQREAGSQAYALVSRKGARVKRLAREAEGLTEGAAGSLGCSGRGGLNGALRGVPARRGRGRRVSGWS